MKRGIEVESKGGAFMIQSATTCELGAEEEEEEE